jgi:hypothetical protein
LSDNHKHATVPEHMASSHRRYADRTIERIRKDAASIGPATAALCELILDERAHPEQGFRTCLGILWLARSYGQQRLRCRPMPSWSCGARRMKDSDRFHFPQARIDRERKTAIERRKKLFADLNRYVTERVGWLTSIPGDLR